MNNSLFRISIASVLFPIFAFAQATDDLQNNFQQFFSVEQQGILVPTVVEVSLPTNDAIRTQFLVRDNTTELSVGSLYKKTFAVELVDIIIKVNGTERPNLVDQEQATSETFPVPAVESGKVELYIEGEEAFTASSFVLDLAKNVSLPVSLEITAEVDGVEEIVLARSAVKSTLILFPETTATKWFLSFEYVQPLRINELHFVQVDSKSKVGNTLRFLAQPERSYTVYFDPEVYVPLPLIESGNLTDDEGVLTVETTGLSVNENFTFADSDGDTIPDQRDNCVSTANPEQTDLDQNNRGDACDDFDRDGILNAVDNCQNDPNRNQLDQDSDGAGDVCDQEESRVTEKYAWIPWVAMSGAILVFILFFWIMLSRMRTEETTTPPRESIKKPQSDRTKR